MAGAGIDVLIVDVGNDANDATRLVADADEFHHTICPVQLSVKRLPIREERFGKTLAHDNHAL